MKVQSVISREKLYGKRFKEEDLIKERHEGKFRKYSSDVALIAAILIKKNRLPV